MSALSTAVASWLGAHPIAAVAVSALALYGAWDLTLTYGGELHDRARGLPSYATWEPDFLGPTVAWTLLAAADQGTLRCRETRPDDGFGTVRRDWSLGSAQLPGSIAMPDQPLELVFLGLLRLDDGSVSVTDAGREAREAIEAGQYAAYTDLLRRHHEAARRAEKTAA